MGGIGWVQLLIIVVVVFVIFGTKKLRGMGSDLGGAVKGFKKALHKEDEPSSDDQEKNDKEGEKEQKTDAKSKHKDQD